MQRRSDAATEQGSGTGNLGKARGFAIGFAAVSLNNSALSAFIRSQENFEVNVAHDSITLSAILHIDLQYAAAS